MLINYLSLLLGVLILVPILYLIPLRLNNKIKIQLVLASLLVSVLGMLSHSIMEWWQTSLILFLLAGLLAYFIGKRNMSVEEEAHQASFAGIGQEQHVVPQGQNTEETFEDLQKEESKSEPLVPLEENIEERFIHSQVVPSEDTIDTSNGQFTQEQVEWIHQDESYEFAQRAEVQQPLYTTEDLSINLEDPTPPPIVDKRIELFEALEEWVPVVEVEGDSVALLESDRPSEDAIEIQLLTEPSIENDEVIDSDMEVESTDPPKQEEGNQLIPNSNVTRAILESMLEELRTAKEGMSSDQFEAYAKSFLIPSLPDLDYYLFASVLRDHYMETNQGTKAYELLVSLEERYSVYEVLNEEIQFMKKQL